MCILLRYVAFIILTMLRGVYLSANHINITTLHLYITSDSRCLLLPIIMLPGCPNAYQADNSCNIDSIKPDLALCSDKIHIRWGTVVIKSEITQQPLTLPNTFVANIFNAMHLANMLKNPYCFHFLLEHNTFLHSRYWAHSSLQFVLAKLGSS